tara:strand:- start:359 stop:727 length:369 start_codon:yes stop_codon:yes gene_type:complete
MHLPFARGGVLVRALEPEESAYERTHEVQVPVRIDVVEDTVYASAFKFRIFGTGVGKDLPLFIIGPEVKEDLAIRGKENFMIAILVVIVSGRGIYVGTGKDFVARPIRILCNQNREKKKKAC